jgi:uncharacterized protein
MKLSIEKPGGIHLIRGYSAAGVRIDDRLHAASVVVNATTVIEGWPPRAISEATEADLQRVLELQPEVLLLGTGRRQEFPRNRCWLCSTARVSASKSWTPARPAAPTTCWSAKDATLQRR